MKTCRHINYDDCMYSSLARIMKTQTEDNCTTPFIHDNSNICTKTQDIQKSFLVAVRRTANQRRDCEAPCHSVFIGIGGKNVREYTSIDYGELTAYFRPRVYRIEEHYLYEFIDILAEVGKFCYIQQCSYSSIFILAKLT